MPDTPLTYTASQRQESTGGILGNHFKFDIEALPDLSFFVQSVTLPSLTSTTVERANPFASIHEVGDHLVHSPIQVTYLIDAAFQTYRSLLWWMQGYGFPHSYDEVKEFREARAKQVPSPRARARELEKTNATLMILQPDTDKIIAEIHFIDVFPTSLGELAFATTDADAPLLTTMATFACTTFHLTF